MDRFATSAVQPPIRIEVECPVCEMRTVLSRREFHDRYGDDADWEARECQECGADLLLQGQNWK